MTIEEKDAYFQLIDSITPEELMQNLPNKNNPDFKEVMLHIIENLSNTYKEYKELEKEENNPSVTELLDEIQRKIEICMNYYGHPLNKKRPQKTKVVFAMSDANKYFITGDLKSTPMDRHLKKAFEYLLYNEYEQNREKVIHYQAGHQNLSGCDKYKDYQTRIYTKRIEEGVTCIFGIFTKKQDNNVYLDNIANNRLRKTVDKQIENIRELFKDQNKKQELLEAHQEFLDELLKEMNFDEETIPFDINNVDEFLKSEKEQSQSTKHK